MEQFVEHAWGTLFPAPLHWSDLARDMARAMERQAVLTDTELSFPNCCRVVLHPADWQALAGNPEALLSGLYECLHRIAQEAGGRFAAPPSILLQLEPRLSPGHAEVHAFWSHDAGLSSCATHTPRKWMDETRPADPTR